MMYEAVANSVVSWLWSGLEPDAHSRQKRGNQLRLDGLADVPISRSPYHPTFSHTLTWPVRPLTGRRRALDHKQELPYNSVQIRDKPSSDVSHLSGNL